MKDGELLKQRERSIALYDEYKGLLTKKQEAVFADYYLYDLSLSEIAENRSISRSGVSDMLKKTLGKMEASEASLGLLKKKKELLSLVEKYEQTPSEKEAVFAEIKECINHGI